MAYSEALAQRIRRAVAGRPGVEEKRMFGGVAFLLGGRMFCGVVKDDLMVRVGPGANDAALARQGARPMDFTGRPMKGYLYVAPDAVRDDADLAAWLDEAAAHAEGLGPKGPAA